MKRNPSRKQNINVLVAGVLPIALTIIVFALFFLAADMKVQIDEQQRAADSVTNAAQNFRWMIENGVEKLSQFAKHQADESESDEAADAERMISLLQSNSEYADLAISYNGQIFYANGEICSDLGIDKYPNCEISGRLVRVSGTENGIQLRMHAENGVDLICVLDQADIQDAMGKMFDGVYYCAVYNVRTGSYVYNNLPFEGNGYYDTLMTINTSGDGEALFSSYNAQARFNRLFGNEDGVVAQSTTHISPWGVALVLPEGVFEEESSEMARLFAVIGVAMVLQLAFSIGFLVLIFCKRRRFDKQNARRRAIARQKLELSVADSGMCVYEYDRGTGQVVDFYDGMTDIGAEMRLQPKSLNEFIAYYKLNDDDVLRLYEIFSEIKAGGVQNADVHAFANGVDHLLRFIVKCLEDGETIIGSVRDCSQDELSQIRIQDEQKFLEMMKPKCASIWDIRVMKNQVRIIYDKRGNTLKRFGIQKDAWVRYEDEYPDRFREQLHPSDAEQFVNAMALSALAEMYRSGKSESVLDCRVRSLRKEGYEWHRRMLRVFKNPENNELIARLYMLNVDAEKNAEMERRERLRVHQQTLTAIGGIYYGLYYVELDTDLCYTAKSHAGELCSDICRPYKTAFTAYIDQYVHPQDREELCRMIDSYMIRKSVREDKHFIRCEFRRRVGDRYEWSAVIIQAARFENAQIRDVVLAFEDLSDLKEGEIV